MAFTAFTLARALQENAGAGFVDNTTAHQFASDDLNACTSEMNYGIVSEAADFRSILVGTEDVLAEAALTDPSRLDVLSEGVFDTVKAKVIAFFKKIIEFVKGIIDKLKAAIYKMTGKVGKWCSLMEPKLRTAANAPGAGDFKVEMYPYDRAFIITGMSKHLDDMFKAWADESNIGDLRSNDVKKALEARKGHTASSAEANRGKSDEDDVSKQYVDTMEKSVENWKNKADDFKDKWPDRVAGFFGESATSMEGVWSEITKKARGGESSKTSQTIKGDWTGMFDAVKGSVKTLENIQKLYDGHLKDLHKIQSQLEKSGSEIKIKDETKDPKVPSNVATAAREYYKAVYDYMILVTQSYETACSSARQTNTNLMNEMVSAYMGALNKLAGFKGDKK